MATHRLDIDGMSLHEHVDHALVPVFFPHCDKHGKVGPKQWLKEEAIKDAEWHAAYSHAPSWALAAHDHRTLD